MATFQNIWDPLTESGLDKEGGDWWFITSRPPSCVLVSDKLTEIIRILTTRSIIRVITIPSGPSHPSQVVTGIEHEGPPVSSFTYHALSKHTERNEIKIFLGKINLHVKMIYGFQCGQRNSDWLHLEQTNLNKIWKLATERSKDNAQRERANHYRASFILSVRLVSWWRS